MTLLQALPAICAKVAGAGSASIVALRASPGIRGARLRQQDVRRPFRYNILTPERSDNGLPNLSTMRFAIRARTYQLALEHPCPRCRGRARILVPMYVSPRSAWRSRPSYDSLVRHDAAPVDGVKPGRTIKDLDLAPDAKE